MQAILQVDAMTFNDIECNDIQRQASSMLKMNRWMLDDFINENSI